MPTSRSDQPTAVEDARIPFEDAKRAFQAFLRSHGWPDDLLWLTRHRVTGRRLTYWVYRPEELRSDAESRAFYESILQTSSSIRIDAVGRLGHRSLVYVQDHGGQSRMLNFGVLVEPSVWVVRLVRSRVWWSVIRIVSRLWGETPFLASSRITGTQASVETLGEAATRISPRRR